MAITAVVVTEAQLAALTDDQIDNFRELLPRADWCSSFLTGRPTRAAVLRYVRDETTNLDTGEVESCNLLAIGVLNAGAPYGLLLCRRIGTRINVRNWYVPLGRLDEVRDALLTLAAANGITRIRGGVTKARIRNAMQTVGATTTGNLVELIVP